MSEKYKKALKQMSARQLRQLLHDANKRTFEELGFILTEYKLRMPYCEVCINKTPIFITANMQYKTGTKELRICPSCNALLHLGKGEYVFFEEEVQ